MRITRIRVIKEIRSVKKNNETMLIMAKIQLKVRMSLKTKE